jgi:hypothetical protein
VFGPHRRRRSLEVLAGAIGIARTPHSASSDLLADQALLDDDAAIAEAPGLDEAVQRGTRLVVVLGDDDALAAARPSNLMTTG